MKLDRDTKIYGSFSKHPGNTGCRLFNTAFEYYDINAIYKSFGVDSIAQAVSAARCLGFGGFAVSMPYKKDVLKHVDEVDKAADEIGAANTVVNSYGVLKAYNTDYYAAKTMITEKMSGNFVSDVYILGDGGYAAAVKQAVNDLGMTYRLITRKNWSLLDDVKKKDDLLIYNCTPLKNLFKEMKYPDRFIDCLTLTKTGKRLAILQASEQFELYTGRPFPIRADI